MEPSVPQGSNDLEVPTAPDLDSLQGSKRGRPSVIHEYCLDAQKEGHTKCIWVCMKKGKKWIAKDIKIDNMNGVLGIPELRQQYSWWKRHSLYSVMGVKEVMFRFAKFDKRTKEISVYVKDFDYKSRIAWIQDAYDRLPSPENPEECGVDIMEKTHASVDYCPNTAYDSFEEKTYCVAERLRKFELQRETLEWLPAMIDFYWQNGIQSDQIDFLENGYFVRQYKNLAWDKWRDAMSHYGKVVYGFQMIEGWHVRSILYLVIASLFLSACVIAISTAILHSFEAGLTAGSYALAIAAVILTALTFFSAII